MEATTSATKPRWPKKEETVIIIHLQNNPDLTCEQVALAVSAALNADVDVVRTADSTRVENASEDQTAIAMRVIAELERVDA